MREYTMEGEISVSRDSTLLDSLWSREDANPDAAALARLVNGQFVDVSVGEFTDRVRALAAGLMGLGVKPGERVAIMSQTRIEWTELDFAIWAAGAVTVPIYETSSADQVEWIVSNSEAVVAVLENAELKATFDTVADRLPGCEHVFVIDKGGLDELIEHGRDVDPGEVRSRGSSLSGNDLATIVYTSGTTGRPKGCMINHGNLIWDVVQTSEAIEGILREGESTLLFLPLAHIMARVIQAACIYNGVKLGYASDISNVRDELPKFQPTFLLAVPRVFEKLYNGAASKARSEGKGWIFDKAADVAIQYSREQQNGGASLPTRLLHGVFDKLVYAKLRDAVGGRVRYAFSGGAALGQRLSHFFNGAGITLLEGYGLTETAAVATVNRPSNSRVGTVGQPIPGCSIRIDEDEEILIRGDNIFQGYWKNDEATEASCDEGGWFRTGDLGSLDEDGFLSIRGRKKEVIVTAGGKNVAPSVLEDRLQSHRLVSQSMVVGEGKPFIAALVTIDPEEFDRWSNEQGKNGGSVAEMTDDPDLRQEIEQAVAHANEAVSKAESIREFVILPNDFSVDSGELTPTLKVKRNVVIEKYAGVIEEIYTE